MTTQDNKDKLAKILWANSQISGVSFEEKELHPSTRGHGLFLKTLGNDVVIDLRLSQQKPFWGHTHPLLVKFNLGMLEQPSRLNNYSVPKTEFTRMIETFQKVHISELASPSFQVTYHNVVIYIDELILEHNIDRLRNCLQKLIQDNPETFFWIVEKDISLLSENDLFFSEDLFSKNERNNIHFCLDLHFLPSIFIISHHLFSEDNSIQIFLAMTEYFEKVVSAKINGKVSIDNEIISQYMKENSNFSDVKKVGRYLIIPREISLEKFFENGILITKHDKSETTPLAIPLACTNDELLDTLDRINKALE